MGVSGGADGQEAPQELGQELQREALQQRLAAPVKLKQLMADRFEQLRKAASIKERRKREKKKKIKKRYYRILGDEKVEDHQGPFEICLEPISHRAVVHNIQHN